MIISNKCVVLPGGFGDVCGPATGVQGNCTDSTLVCAANGKCGCKQGYTQSGNACSKYTLYCKLVDRKHFSIE